jgi:hypothetical protein
VAKLVALLLLRQLSGFEEYYESRHLSKIQNGQHKQRSGQQTLSPPKNIQKNVVYKKIIPGMSFRPERARLWSQRRSPESDSGAGERTDPIGQFS